MITNHKLLVDRDCPMCRAYGKAFVKFKLVDEKTMHNTNTGQTKYGVDAFIRILAHNKPNFHRFLNLGLVYALLSLLYGFISYNRKIIYPVDSNIACSCDPDLNTKYRVAYIGFVALLTGLILNTFSAHIDAYFGIAHSAWRELAICIGQVAWQGAAIYLIFRDKLWDYLGNMSTVSLIGGLLLLPVLLLNYYLVLHPLVLMGAFTLIVGLMLLEHIRRCKLLGVPTKLTLSWILFRCTVLVAIVLSLGL